MITPRHRPLSPAAAMLAAALALGAAGYAHAQQADPADPCVGSVEARPPDPRCQETLDGRPPVEPAWTAPRLLLRGPQLGARAVFWPVVRTSGFIESNHLVEWARALLTSDDGRLGIRPQLHYSTSFLTTGGARVFYRPVWLSGGELGARADTAGPGAVLGDVGFRGSAALPLDVHAQWNRRRDRLFAGIGPASEAELNAQGLGLSRYAADVWLGEARWSPRLFQHLLGSLHADLQRRDYGTDTVGDPPSIAERYGRLPGNCARYGLPEGCVDSGLVPGFNEVRKIAHLGAGLALTFLDPDRDGGGIRFGLDGTYGLGIAGDPSRHVQLAADTVFGIGGRDRTLLLRAWGAIAERTGSVPVPFDELVSPAGSQGMRGFAEGRFRGPSGLVGSAEYRWLIARALDASLFVDVGGVADRGFTKMKRDNLYSSVGVGLRRFSPGAYYWRASVEDGVQLAYSREGGVRLLLSTAAF